MPKGLFASLNSQMAEEARTAARARKAMSYHCVHPCGPPAQLSYPNLSEYVPVYPVAPIYPVNYVSSLPPGYIPAYTASVPVYPSFVAPLGYIQPTNLVQSPVQSVQATPSAWIQAVEQGHATVNSRSVVFYNPITNSNTIESKARLVSSYDYNLMSWSEFERLGLWGTLRTDKLTTINHSNGVGEAAMGYISLYYAFQRSDGKPLDFDKKAHEFWILKDIQPALTIGNLTAHYRMIADYEGYKEKASRDSLGHARARPLVQEF